MGEVLVARPGLAVNFPRGSGPYTWSQSAADRVVAAYMYAYFAPLPPPVSVASTIERSEGQPAPPARVVGGDAEADEVDTSKGDTSRYIGTIPTQHLKILHADTTGQLVSVLWDTTTMHTRPLPHPGNPPCPLGQIEFAYIVEGACTIRNGSGIETRFVAGEGYLVPRGMVYEWHSEGFTRKIACNFKPNE